MTTYYAKSISYYKVYEITEENIGEFADETLEDVNNNLRHFRKDGNVLKPIKVGDVLYRFVHSNGRLSKDVWEGEPYGCTKLTEEEITELLKNASTS